MTRKGRNVGGVKLREAMLWHKYLAKLNPHPTDEPEWCCQRIVRLRREAKRKP